MKSRIPGLAASLLVLASWQASAQTLSVGDNAPALDVSRYVKGEKIEKLDKDQTYVVEFWATWCGPCKATIPHLTQLQKKYKDRIKFIGVSVWEQDPKEVEPFVKEMGDKMDYSVALDMIPKGEDGQSGKMAKNWMAASGSEGIPTAFLIKGGKVAWIGHPMEIDKPLEKVVEPNFDLANFISNAREAQIKEKAKQQAQRKSLATLQKRAAELGNNPSPKQLLSLFDKTLEESPELEEMLGMPKYGIMVQLGDKNASTYGSKLVEGQFKDQAEALNQIAWMNLDPESKVDADKLDPKLALKAALRANELTKNENGAILDTLALAYFKTGDAAKALSTQEKAVALMPTGEGSDDMKTRLKKYQKAAEKKP